ncbi:hypothetical protein Godav_012047 [Gossypium davidsonii]|uniref:Uncharacterized protein n=2 Tax=Gossypium TaxID=3633 RepID=A0A7J9IYG2_9ROSI|nr:hypothetical protein [Gossypium davidsonii]MBA0826818.1 hypothetical protein [Gossypium armourianum]
MSSWMKFCHKHQGQLMQKMRRHSPSSK